MLRARSSIRGFLLRPETTAFILVSTAILSCSDAQEKREGAPAGTGGASDETSDLPAPKVVGLSDWGSYYRVELEDTEGLFTLSCSLEPILVEVNPPDEASSFPSAGTPYIFEGKYYENDFNLGCDVVECSPLGSSIRFTKTGVVSLGLSSAGGAGGAGGETGVEEFESYVRLPPFRFTNRFYADDECAGKRYVMDSVVLDDVSKRN